MIQDLSRSSDKYVCVGGKGDTNIHHSAPNVLNSRAKLVSLRYHRVNLTATMLAMKKVVLLAIAASSASAFAFSPRASVNSAAKTMSVPAVTQFPAK